MTGLLALTLLSLGAGQDHAARMDRFLAALPPAEAEPEQADASASEREQRLVAANPGKQAVIRAVLGDNAGCTHRASDTATATSLRSVAESLSDAEFDKLTEFYGGPEYKAMLVAGDKADMALILAKYPLERFMLATQRVLMNEKPEQLTQAIDACEAATSARFAQAGVKSE